MANTTVCDGDDDVSAFSPSLFTTLKIIATEDRVFSLKKNQLSHVEG